MYQRTVKVVDGWGNVFTTVTVQSKYPSDINLTIDDLKDSGFKYWAGDGWKILWGRTKRV